MRTLIVIVLLGAVAIAAGASFVVRAGAQQRAADLSGSCNSRHGPVARGVDSIVTCQFTATNTGGEPIRAPRLVFVPAPSIAIPERYFFFSVSLDGEEVTTGGYATVYDFAPINPGESTRLELVVIVNASGPFGAVAELASDAGVLDRVAFESDVSDVMPGDNAPTLTLERLEAPPPGDPASAAYRVVATNNSDGVVRDSVVELHPGPEAFVRGGAWTAVPNAARFTSHYGEIAPSAGVSEIASVVSTSGDCLYASPAAIASFTYHDGVVRVARLADYPTGCGSTSRFEAPEPPAGVTSMGQGGFGPDGAERPFALPIIALLAGVIGLAAVRRGVRLVR